LPILGGFALAHAKAKTPARENAIAARATKRELLRFMAVRSGIEWAILKIDRCSDRLSRRISGYCLDFLAEESGASGH
jgi:hypothetical protein